LHGDGQTALETGGTTDEAPMIEREFHKKIYTKAAIEAAAKAYAKLAKVKIKTQGNYFHVTLHDVDQDVLDFVMDDFANHVLFETISGRQA